MINTAIIFVDADEKFENAPIACAQITSVPLLKRILIDLRRDGLENIYVLVSRADKAIEAILKDTERKVEFKVRHFADAGWREEIAKSKDRQALVLTADRLSDFRVLQTLAETTTAIDHAVLAFDQNDEDATGPPETAFYPNDGRVVKADEMADAKETGIYVLPAETAAQIKDFKAGSVKEAVSSFIKNDKAIYFDIGNGFVQTIASRGDIRRAERRILRYIYKATDGKHALLNKRILMPFLKIILRTPLTPNMISIIGVMTSLGCGYFYARGQYLYSIIGALLAYVSGLLDHVDGSVARLKSKESAFGAHFETVCDFIFYFVFGVGMTLGLYRKTGSQIYIFLGVAAFFGMLISLLIISYRRKQFAGNPSLYAAEAHGKLEANSQNGIIRYARHCYFVVRRPILPYYLFILTALSLLPFVLFMTALSANLFWIFMLYTSRLFRTEQAKT
jgi:phosphatidylglycerophosphate synthase